MNRIIHKLVCMLLVLFLQGCVVMGNTGAISGLQDKTVSLYSKTVSLVSNEHLVGLPEVEEEEKDASYAPMYDTLNHEDMAIAKYWNVSDFNSAEDRSLRYMRLDEKLLGCLIKLRDKVGPFSIKLGYVAPESQLAIEEHSCTSIEAHESGRVVDIIPPCSVPLMTRKIYELCGCEVGIGVNEKWIHLEMMDEMTYPWSETCDRKSTLRRVNMIHSAYCVNHKMSKNGFFD
jgi:hypothetical protein